VLFSNSDRVLTDFCTQPSVRGEPPPELSAEQLYIDSSLPVEKIFDASSVNRYLKLNERDLKRYLPEGFGGHLVQREFESTSSKSILIRFATSHFPRYVLPSQTSITPLPRAQALQAIEALKAAEENAFIRSSSPAPPVLCPL